jgi:hypothetical protein
MAQLSKSICKLLGILSAFTVFATLASAGVVTYTNSGAFEAATDVNLVENFGTLTNGQDISSGSTVDGLTYSGLVLTDGAADLDITNQFDTISGNDLGADHTASGSADTYFLSGEGATITFPEAVTAVGMYFDVNLDSANSFGFTDSNGDSASVTSSSYETNTFVFAGLTSTTPFNSITFSSSGDSNAIYLVPEIEASAQQVGPAFVATPEPGSAQLLFGGIALLAVGLFGRRLRLRRTVL